MTLQCRDYFFRVWSAMERGEDGESFRRLQRAPSPWGEGWGEGGPDLFNHDEKMRPLTPGAESSDCFTEIPVVDRFAPVKLTIDGGTLLHR